MFRRNNYFLSVVFFFMESAAPAAPFFLMASAAPAAPNQFVAICFIVDFASLSENFAGKLV